ncbi:hypothetical protein Pmani_025463 [Petrolisthes manimaculis]|uniref:Alpha 1,4-glycosyltransferase domain-containing protein n=1 Tax=Petrolisthes manimaculis TaxID=1843537 RepID=A0AAE1P820_9EUCA|nr:hypothetical protein Pmani_025463 [Petrolisthes manimaculis]
MRLVLLGGVVCVLVFMFAANQYLKGWSKHTPITRVVADYDDQYTDDTEQENQEMKNEGENDNNDNNDGGGGGWGWREVVCPSFASAPLPPFPIPLPPFQAYANKKGGEGGAEGGSSPGTNNIYFLETTCAITLNAKMACAVESAATHHPTHTIHLALTATHISGTDQMLHTLAALPNTHLTALHPNALLTPSHPLVHWLNHGSWADNADWAGVTLSDIVRLMVVCESGGMYLDLDLLTLAPLPSSQAWLGRERWDQVSNGAFRLPKGHWLCGNVTNEVIDGYDGGVWGSSGPKAMQRALVNICNTANLSTITQCHDLQLLDPKTLYPIHYKEWEMIFLPPTTTTTTTTKTATTGGGGVGEGDGGWWVPGPDTLALHLWNHFSAAVPLRPGDGSVLDLVARKNCPKVYRVVQNVNKLKQQLGANKWKQN